MATVDLETVTTQTRKIFDSHIASVTDLVIARRRVDELRVQLAKAEQEDKKAYARAPMDGWSKDKLKKLGLESDRVMKRRHATDKSTTAVFEDRG